MRRPKVRGRLGVGEPSYVRRRLYCSENMVLGGAHQRLRLSYRSAAKTSAQNAAREVAGGRSLRGARKRLKTGAGDLHLGRGTEGRNGLSGQLKSCSHRSHRKVPMRVQPITAARIDNSVLVLWVGAAKICFLVLITSSQRAERDFFRRAGRRAEKPIRMGKHNNVAQGRRNRTTQVGRCWYSATWTIFLI